MASEKESVSVTIGGDKTIVFETGQIAKQADGAVLVRLGDTVVFSAVSCADSASSDITFFPLRIDYQEKFFSVGRTVGGFIKREGRPTEKEALVSRLIDRPLRPMFENGFHKNVQISSFVWSYDRTNSPDVLAICASSASLLISSVPFHDPVAAVRLGLIDGVVVINPTVKEMEKSKMDCVLAGTESCILMIEGGSDFISDDKIISAISKGLTAIRDICQAMKKLKALVGKPKQIVSNSPDKSLFKLVEDSIKDDVNEIIRIPAKKERELALSAVFSRMLSNPNVSEVTKESAVTIINNYVSKMIRDMIVNELVRCDGRSWDEVRPIDIQMSFLPKVHGSVLFTRGETQALVVCTLGGDSMAQKFESLDGEGIQRFYFQYFFPSFCVGEVGKSGSPGRRELGHGKLAEKSLDRLIPSKEVFSYSIRIESTITESNGSSSMASVCGGSLALMDAGVPVSKHVAGIAMGMIIINEDSEPVILTDISATEDAVGDVDFKLAGNEDGFTGFQMDVKIKGISESNFRKLFKKASNGLNIVLSKMNEACKAPKTIVAANAPKITSIKIKQNKIPIIIGSNGRTIRQISEQTGSEISIDQSNFTVCISSPTQKALEEAIRIINDLISEVCIGKTYNGKIKSVASFGIFVEIAPGKEGLCHASELTGPRPAFGQPIRMNVGDSVTVKVIGINEKGQIKLSQKV